MKNSLLMIFISIPIIASVAARSEMTFATEASQQGELNASAENASTVNQVLAGTQVSPADCQEISSPIPGYELVWSDEFSGTNIDPKKWNIKTGWRDNAERTADSVTVKDGILSLHTFTENGVNHTGFLTTRDLFTAKYGYFEARIRFHSSPGEWCAFWLQSSAIDSNIGHPKEAGIETDIIEHRAQDAKGTDLKNKIMMNLHWNGYRDEEKSLSSDILPSVSAVQDEWHTYSVLWNKDSYTFYVDGQARWKSKDPISEKDEELRLTCEVRDKDWAGNIPKEGYGTKSSSVTGMDVNWVRVWQANKKQ